MLVMSARKRVMNSTTSSCEEKDSNRLSLKWVAKTVSPRSTEKGTAHSAMSWREGEGEEEEEEGEEREGEPLDRAV